LPTALWITAAAFALAAGITDLRWRRIPNWLTYPAVPIAIAFHWVTAGRHAALLSLGGAALGLAILLPFVLLRQLGGGDWKLVGALGAFFEMRRLLLVLFLALLINLIMAIALVIWKRRLGQTLRNMGHILLSFISLHLPGQELTIDNPEATKVPFGIAAAIAVLLYVSSQQWIAF
jgi:prepilin peptidase CpaA